MFLWTNEFKTVLGTRFNKTMLPSVFPQLSTNVRLSAQNELYVITCMGALASTANVVRTSEHTYKSEYPQLSRHLVVVLQANLSHTLNILSYLKI